MSTVDRELVQSVVAQTLGCLPDDGRLSYSVAEAARLVGYSRQTLYTAIHDGLLVAKKHRQGANYRIGKPELLRWLNRRD